MIDAFLPGFQLTGISSPPRRVRSRRLPSDRSAEVVPQAEFTFPSFGWKEFAARRKIAGVNFAKLRDDGDFFHKSEQQIAALDWILSNRDDVKLISAPTGSGKTLLELISAVCDLSKAVSDKVKIAIIVTPRINLTYQHAFQEAADIISDKSLPVIAVSSGNKAQRKKDFKAIEHAGRGIIVITPETLCKELRKEGSLLREAQLVSLSLDESHHLLEGAGSAGDNRYGKALRDAIDNNPAIFLRLFSATHFSTVAEGRTLTKYLGEVSKGRKVALRALDLPPPKLELHRRTIEQVPDYLRLKK